MRSYKRYTRRKRLLKQIAVVALVFILGFVLLRAVSYMAIQGEIPMINSFNLFRREADTSFGWNLILVNDDYCVPRNYEVELTELSNGEKVDSRIYPQLQQMFDDARAEGLELFVREGYRTTQDQKDIMNERIQQYQDEGYSRGEAKKLAKEYVAEPGTSEHELGIAVDINADTSKCSSDAVYTWLANNAYKYGFIKRYPDNKIEITGVNNEPWHYRYVGVDAALEMQKKGMELDAFSIDVVENRMIDGRPCLVIAINEHVEINGISVRPVPLADRKTAGEGAEDTAPWQEENGTQDPFGSDEIRPVATGIRSADEV